MQDIKQVILVRTDLNMRKGKIAAQTAHASLKVFLDKAFFSDGVCSFRVDSDEEKDWLSRSFKKVVLGVMSEADLLRAHELAKEHGLLTSLIQDEGRTEFHGVSTYTTCAIGPAVADRIDVITGTTGLISTKLL